jgi:hypothetical protein
MPSSPEFAKKNEGPKVRLLNLANKLKEEYKRDPAAEKSKHKKDYYTKILGIAEFIIAGSPNAVSPFHAEHAQFRQLVEHLNHGQEISDENIDQGDKFLENLIIMLEK